MFQSSPSAPPAFDVPVVMLSLADRFGAEGRRPEVNDAQRRRYLYLQAGTAKAQVDGVTANLSPGSVLTVPAGAVCKLELRPNAKGFWMSFSETFLLSRVMLMLGAPRDDFWMSYDRPTVADYWTGPDKRRDRARVMRELIAAQARLDHYPQAAVAAYAIIILLSPDVEGKGRWAVLKGEMDLERDKAINLVVAFRERIEQNFRRQLGVQAYCQLMGVTPARLGAACKAETGRTPLELIHERVMLEAKRELIYSARPASQIAYRLGFKDTAYFSRFFKLQTARTPREFRRSNANIHELS